MVSEVELYGAGEEGLLEEEGHQLNPETKEDKEKRIKSEQNSSDNVNPSYLMNLRNIIYTDTP